ncbi:uncharacterized protein PV09_04466 [Verruconis gallopava]|uniref:Uncharacterized protein n=1 Tax=Verruconis gallopava TaxID=253628 RepID=A0A0D2AE42_9PEZI|nr:uncharacterized protein PV09_04466 [Verruconis gallopava]KIW04735.1 hypothetical protein PV09_04466 [Verruconis gallopava]
MSTSFLGLPVSQHAVARGVTVFFGILSTSMGLRALVDPAGYAAIFGVPALSSTMATASRNPFIKAAGASRLAGGLGTLACVLLGQDKGAALGLCAGAIVGIMDGLSLKAEIEATRKELGGKTHDDDDGVKSLEESEGKAWGHMMFGPIAAALGSWLYYVS